MDAATVHEAYGRRGALPSAIKPLAAAFCVCGPAFTVDSPPGDNLCLHRAVYRAAEGDVLVVEAHDPEFGVWGEILSVAASARRLGGLVVNGGVRDSERLAEIGFPVFAAHVCVRGTVKDPRGGGQLGLPLRIGDVVVRNGDAVVGDRDGVVVVEADAVPAIAAAARDRIEKEQDVMARLRAGETTLSIYGLPDG
jgi:4-hydroxy-4-methyl-2-oxoglutarate aldolase